MTQKLNNDNDLQGLKTEHQTVTSYIKHLAISALLSGTARIKSNRNLTGQCFVMPNVPYTKPLSAIIEDTTQINKYDETNKTFQ